MLDNIIQQKDHFILYLLECFGILMAVVAVVFAIVITICIIESLINYKKK